MARTPRISNSRSLSYGGYGQEVTDPQEVDDPKENEEEETPRGAEREQKVDDVVTFVLGGSGLA